MAEGSASVTVCGLMSGTSADGIDVAIVRITDPPHGGNVPAAFRLLRFAEVPWSAEDRKVCVEQTTAWCCTSTSTGQHHQQSMRPQEECAHTR
jgi:1,6-anhydro-N-acetylmuramate kinase